MNLLEIPRNPWGNRPDYPLNGELIVYDWAVYINPIPAAYSKVWMV